VKQPVAGKKGPPTEHMLERIKELKDMPEFAPHLDWLMDAIQNRNMLNTMGQAGILINEMKKKIIAAGGNPTSKEIR
jgi:hypothetical protein